MRKCGLKYPDMPGTYHSERVTSLAEVWIEISSLSESLNCKSVTSLAEVWIEIVPRIQIRYHCIVTSLAEVWIEITEILFRG